LQEPVSLAITPPGVWENVAVDAQEGKALERQEEAKIAPRRLDVQTVLRGAREAILLHGAEEYRLRLTSNGKLILTK
jgi:hemin uptake protein HemP